MNTPSALPTLLTLGLLIGTAAQADTATFWPGDPAATLHAQQDSSLTIASPSLAIVETGVKAPWPGLRLDFKPARDLSKYAWIELALTNLTARPVEICLSVKSLALQGRSPGGKLSLAPYAAGTLHASMMRSPWRLDAPLKLEGMNGVPVCEGQTAGLFDVTRTTSFHIFRGGVSAPARYGLMRVTLGGETTGGGTVYAATNFLPFVDAYGQFSHATWPGKIANDAALEKSRADEEAWLAAHGASPIPGADRFGGWGTGPKLRATGFFRTEKVNGKWWFVDPDGHLFFSHGVDCVNPANVPTGITHREAYFAALPAKNDPLYGGFWAKVTWKAAHNFYSLSNNLPYACYDFGGANCRRKYGADWQNVVGRLAHRRIRAWGLNTIANWSSAKIYNLRQTPYTLCLGTGGTPRRKGSKGWWGPLPDPDDPAFEKIFRERALRAAGTMKDDPWCLGVFVDNELSWSGLPDLDHVAEKYFVVVSRVLHEELPNHLYLGARIAWGTDGVYLAAARHCDVVSVNIYSRLATRDLPEGAVDKPMIIGEFHFGALDRGLFHTGLVATENQAERAACYRSYVNACLDNPRYIGTHWFQWKDQPLTGRSDGENYQIGFLTVTDAPYPELVDAARDVAAKMYARRFAP